MCKIINYLATLLLVGTVVFVIGYRIYEYNMKQTAKGNKIYLLTTDRNNFVIDGHQRSKLSLLNQETLIGAGPQGVVLTCKDNLEYRLSSAINYTILEISNDRIPYNSIDCRRS